MSYAFDASALIKAGELAPRRVARIVKGQYAADFPTQQQRPDWPRYLQPLQAVDFIRA